MSLYKLIIESKSSKRHKQGQYSKVFFFFVCLFFCTFMMMNVVRAELRRATATPAVRRGTAAVYGNIWRQHVSSSSLLLLLLLLRSSVPVREASHARDSDEQISKAGATCCCFCRLSFQRQLFSRCWLVERWGLSRASVVEKEEVRISFWLFERAGYKKRRKAPFSNTCDEQRVSDQRKHDFQEHSAENLQSMADQGESFVNCLGLFQVVS